MIIEQVSHLLEDTAYSFRLGMEAQAAKGMVAIIDALPLVLERQRVVDVEQLNSLLRRLFSAQERNDLLYLADLLEYELVSLLADVAPENETDL